MSGKIKFRVYDDYNECYLDISDGINDGLIGISTDGEYIFCLEDGEVQRYKTYDDAVYSDKGEEIFEKYYAYIIEQSTGIKDKNGVEICEGDIVKCYSQDTYPIGAVVYSKEYAEYEIRGYDTKTNRDYSLEHFNHLNNKYLEVIGNIHEDPELLGDKE